MTDSVLVSVTAEKQTKMKKNQASLQQVGNLATIPCTITNFNLAPRHAVYSKNLVHSPIRMNKRKHALEGHSEHIRQHHTSF